MNTLHSPTSKAPVNAGEPVRTRSTLLCIGAALLLAAVSLAGIPGFFNQIRSMDPTSVTKEQQEKRYAIVESAFQGQRRGRTAGQAIELMYRQQHVTPRFDNYEAADENNGLYACLKLLGRLRTEPTATQPSGFANLERSLRAAEDAPPVRIYHVAVQQEIEKGFRRNGFDERESAVQALRSLSFMTHHRPVIRELVDRLLNLGESLQQAGDNQNALRVEHLAIRILADLIKDSPTYDLALLAAERMPRAFKQVARAHMDMNHASLAADADSAGRGVAAFPKNWHESTPDDSVNIVPFAGSVPPDLEYDAQRTLLGTFARSGALLAACAFLLIAVFWLGLITLLHAGARSVPMRWRGRSGPALGTFILMLPLLAILLTPMGGRLSHTWIFTLQTGVSVAYFSLSGFLALGLAARVGVALPPSLEKERLPMTTVSILVVSWIVMVGVASLAFPARAEATRPPVIAQWFRKELAFAGLASAIIGLIWFVAGMIRRKRGNLPSGLIARTQLAVVAQTLPVVALLLALVLLTNARRNASHQEVYAAACHDAVANKLGSNWQARYFGPALELAASTEPARRQ